MCVPGVGPQGTISQHPACHRLQQGGRAGEVTGGEGDGGRSLVGLINQEIKVCPSSSRADFHVDRTGSGGKCETVGGLPVEIPVTAQYLRYSLKAQTNTNDCSVFLNDGGPERSAGLKPEGELFI